jgi:hypothetical protein
MRQKNETKEKKKKQKKSISDHPRPYQKRKKKIHKAPPQIEPYRAMRVQTIDTPHTVKDKFFLHFQIGLVVVNAANVRGTIGADKDHAMVTDRRGAVETARRRQRVLVVVAESSHGIRGGGGGNDGVPAFAGDPATRVPEHQ